MNARWKEKHALKAEKEARKAMRAEEKRLARGEKRKSKEVKADFAQPSMASRPTVAVTGNILPEVQPDQELTQHPFVTDVDVVPHQNVPMGEDAVNAASIETPKVTPSVPDTPKSKEDKVVKRAPFTPMKGDRGIKKLFAKFKRKPKDEKSFAGGAALTNATSRPAPTGLHENDSSSISSFLESDMEEHGEDWERPESRVSGVTEGSDEFEEARDTFDEGLAPPPTFVTDGKKTSCPVRDTRFHEEL